jgi:hypothetical protein
MGLGPGLPPWLRCPPNLGGAHPQMGNAAANAELWQAGEPSDRLPSIWPLTRRALICGSTMPTIVYRPGPKLRSLRKRKPPPEITPPGSSRPAARNASPAIATMSALWRLARATGPRRRGSGPAYSRRSRYRVSCGYGVDEINPTRGAWCSPPGKFTVTPNGASSFPQEGKGCEAEGIFFRRSLPPPKTTKVASAAAT